MADKPLTIRQAADADRTDGSVRMIRLRWPATCHLCGETIEAGTHAWWDIASKRFEHNDHSHRDG